ncbi:MAG: hypothetical protein ABH851_05300 [Methanobacteriota archaeon]
MVVSMYARKISKTEAECGFILIEKESRNLFPSSGERFNLIYHGNHLPVVVNEIVCECRGPGKPHEHFHLHVPVELNEGDNIKIVKTEGGFELCFEG